MTSSSLPANSALVSPGGINFIIDCTLLQLDKDIDSPCIINMFNSVSHTAYHSILTSIPSLTGLLLFFDLLYKDPNHSWYRASIPDPCLASSSMMDFTRPSTSRL
jgi:hypothetical protein